LLKENKYYIYRHIRVDTDEIFYIGRGERSRYISKYGRNRIWKNITNKSDWYAEIIIHNLTNEEANIKEKEFINYYRNFGYCKANISSGGAGLVGVRPWNAGKKLSKEHAYKCGNAFRNKKRPEHSRTMKLKWKAGCDFGRREPVNRARIYCIDDGLCFKSITDAANYYGLHRQHIGKVCSGKLKTTGNKRFMFI